jgi:NAD(P)-dependent dehydrogenase (short-subunit alcohol dehydrogenase family)
MSHVNWHGTLHTVHFGLPHTLAAGRGHIVIVSSGEGLRSFPQAAVYGATKAAQRMFGEALRHELAGTGVSLTLVYPGEIATSPHDHEKDHMPAWYRGGPSAAPASALAETVVPPSRPTSARCTTRPWSVRSAWPTASARRPATRCCGGCAATARRRGAARHHGACRGGGAGG